jgi:uncharacterized membrane protein
MITKNNIFSLIYHFLFAVSSSVIGAIVASWPLLFIFMIVQKTYETVHMSLFKVMHNYNQLMFYLLWPFKKQLKMDNFPTSANAVTNFDSFFVIFHHILFNNSDWLFDPNTDPIINVLTEGFFASCFAVAGVIYELYFAEKLLRK